MSNTVDRRVVEMRFDNQQFESRTRTTLGTLEKLKNALNFSHASDGLDKLNKSMKNVNVGGLRTALDGVQVSFSKLEAMALTALTNITNRAVDAGIALAKNLTIDQLSAGWDKYADKTSAVQTIMAATKDQFTDTAEQMEFVNAQLERLNWFTDETSYNFVDMVGNIGKFTSNGVALDDAATAMQGIATWAAVSGGNASTASRAMYQLSQAMGMGSVRLQDWMSIETANMATYEFKEMVLETAASMGILKKTSDGAYKSIESGNKITVKGFRESLKEGWFTSDVLVEVLNQYGGFTNKLYEVSEATGQTATDLLQWIERYRDAGTNASSVIQDMADDTGISVQEIQKYLEELTDNTYELGEKAFRAAQEAKTFGEAIDATKDAVSTGWMNTFEIIFGDYEEARVRWTALANELWDIFASGAEARNELLEEALGLPESLVTRQTTGWGEIESAIEAAGIPLDDFIQKCLELGGKGGDGITSIEDFKNSLTDGWLTGDLVAKAIDSFIGPVQEAGEVTEAVGRTFEDFQRIVYETINGNYGWSTGAERYKKFTEAGWNDAEMQAAVNKAKKGGVLTMEDYERALEGVTDEQLKSAGYTDEQIQQLRDLQAQYEGLDTAIDDVSGTTVGLRTGSELLFDGISKGWDAIKGIFSAMKQGWDDAFPPMTADRLYNILEAFNGMTNRFHDWVYATGEIQRGDWNRMFPSSAETNLQNLRDTFHGLADIFGIVVDTLKSTGRFLKDTFGGQVGSVTSRILEFTAKVGKNITAFREWLKTNEAVYKVLSMIKVGASEGITALKDWFTAFKETPIVQEKIQAVKDWFAGLWASAKAAFPNTIAKIEQFANSLKNLFNYKPEDALRLLSARIKSLGRAIKTDLLAEWEKLKSSKFFTEFGAGLKEMWEGIKNSDLVKSIKGFFQPLFNFFGSLKETLVKYGEDAEAGFTSIGEKLKNVATYLKEHIGSIVAAFALFMAAKSVYGFVQTIIGIAKAITAPITTVVNALEAFSSAATGIKRATTAFAVVEVVMAIIALAYAVVKVGEVPQEQIDRGLGVIVILGVVVGALIGVMAALTKAKASLDPKQIRSQAVGMLKIVELAAAIMFVAIAFEKILKAVDGKTWDQIVPVIVGMIAAIGVLAGIGFILSKFGGEGGKGVTGPLIAIGVDVYILTECFKSILDAVTKEGVTDADITQATDVVSAMVVAIGLVAVGLAAISKIKSDGSFGKIGGGIFAVALAVKILVSAFADIMDMTIVWDATRVGVLIGMIAAIGIIMVALSKMPASAGLNGLGVLGVAASVEILAVAIRTIASLSASDIAKGIIAIGAMMTFIAIFTLLTRKGSELGGKSGLAFLGMSAAILILAGAIAVLSLLNEDDVIIGTMAIVAMITAVGIMMGLSSFAKDLKVGPFIGITIVIGLLTAAIVALSFLDQGAVLMGALAISSMLTACGVMMLLMRAAKGISAGPFIGLIAVIGVLTVALVAVSCIEPGAALTAVVALTAVMGVFTVMSVILSFVTRVMSNDMTASIDCLLMMSLVLGLIASVIVYMANSIDDPSVAMDLSLSLAALFFSLSKVFTAVAMLGKVSGVNGGGTSLIQGILGMIAILGVIGALCYAIGALVPEETLTKMKETMEKSFPVLRTIGESVGQVLGGLLEGIFTIDITGLVRQLLVFAQGMRVFAGAFTGISFDEGTSGAIKAIGSTLLYLAGADLINSITKLFGGDQSSLSTAFEGLPEFGDMLKQFGEKLGKDFNADSVSKAATAAESLTKMANSLPTSGGWKAKILGDKESLGDFGESINTFADDLKDFSDKVSGQDIDTEAIGNVADAASKLVTLVNNLPASGGWKQKILGDKTELDTFGETLKTFGTGINDFCDALNGRTDFSAISDVATAAQDLVTLQDALPDEDGFFDDFFGGTTDLSEFGTQLTTFAAALVGLCTSADGINFDTIDNICTRGTSLVTLAANEGMDNASNLEDLGKYAKKLGEGLKDFYGKIDDIDTSKIQTLTTELTNLTAMFSDTSIFENSGISTFSDTLSTLGTTSVSEFSNAFVTGRQTVILALVGFLTAATNVLSSTDTFNSAGSDAVSGYLEGFTSGQEEGGASSKAQTLLNNLVEPLTRQNHRFKTAGTSAVNAYLTEFQNKTEDAKTIGSSVATNVRVGLGQDASDFRQRGIYAASAFVNAISSYQKSANSAGAALRSNAMSGLSKNISSARTYGSNFGSAFASGIRGYGTSSYNAAYSIGRRAVDGLKKAIDSHSPSKEAMASGDYFGVGFTSQILKWISKAGNAATELGDVTVISLNKAISDIPSMLDGYMDFDPVITPRVDLTSAQSSVAMLNSMFADSIGTTMNIASMTGATVETARAGVTYDAKNRRGQTAETETQPVTQNNNFYITSNNPDEVANRVSVILQQQVERKRASRGR